MSFASIHIKCVWYSYADSMHCNRKHYPVCFSLSLAHREEGYWTTVMPSSSSSFCSPSLRLPSCNASSSASSSTRPTWQQPAVASFTSLFISRTSSASPGKTASPRIWRSWWWVSHLSLSLSQGSVHQLKTWYCTYCNYLISATAQDLPAQNLQNLTFPMSIVTYRNWFWYFTNHV